MKSGVVISLSLCALLAVAYLTASKWTIHHRTLTFHDVLRSDRPVAVDIAVRRDREWAAMAGITTLPVAIINHGNTVKYTEYSFLADLFAARGYMVVSIQHDLDIDGPMVTKVGEEYAGRRSQYDRGIANIKFAIDELRKLQPNSDYRHLIIVGHSSGGDISMYFAKRYPELIEKVVTLDNLRVPLVTDGKFKILSIRSNDPAFKPDPGVVPDDEMCRKAGITVVRTSYLHNELSDRGPSRAKTEIRAILDNFLAAAPPPRTDQPDLTTAGAVAMPAND
jgi:pimeloyl-ACP methyl ester carboxylesterase